MILRTLNYEIDKQMTDIKLGGIELRPVKERPRRFALFLWGMSGCGKTTLAATAPGKKLWITFDPDATAPITTCPDEIIELELANQPDSIAEKFKDSRQGLCRDIDRLLGEDTSIETVVIDSITTFGEKALAYGIVAGLQTKKGKSENISIEQPGYTGYGNKNTWTQLLVRNMLEITLKHNRHIIIVAHEDTPTKDKDGNLLFTSIMIGSALAQQLPIKPLEVWHMDISGSKGEHRIQIRPCRGFKPMKTRMFTTTGEPEFRWKFDPDKWKGEGIADWYEKWKANEYKKIALP